MDDVALQMMRLAGKGYSCAQILLWMALDLRGESNPGLVRAAAGLAYGCGSGSGSCGALTGGCCLLALYAGKGSDEETGSDRLAAMLQDLSDWFSHHVGEAFGAITCERITGPQGPSAARQRCGTIVADTYAKAMEILTSYGFDPTEGAPTP